MTQTLLKVTDLSKRFGGFSALSAVSFEIAAGERFGLIGPNGSGKTTLVNCIAGALWPSTGSIVFNGMLITDLAVHQRARLGIGRSFQVPRPFRSMSVYENLRVAAEFATSPQLTARQRRELVERALDRMGLTAKSTTLAGNLSQVELRKMELARAIAAEPRLLISDETMAGLSNAEVDEVLSCLDGMKQDGISIIMIEHIMHAVVRFSDRIMCLEAGRPIAIGDPQAVIADPRVQEAYLGT